MDNNNQDQGLSVSDQARTAGDYQPNFGAHGTTDAPPRTAQVYPPTPSTDPMLTSAPQQPRTSNPNVTVGQAANGPVGQAPVQAVAPATAAAPAAPLIQDVTPPPAATPAYAPAPQYPAEAGTPIGAPAPAAAEQPKSIEQRVAETEKDIQTIANAVGTVLTKLDEMAAAQAPATAVAPALPTPGMPTNTGQLGAAPPDLNPMPGTAAPNAPSPHQPGVQAPVAQQTGPVMPAPVPQSERPLPGQKRVIQITPEEANLTVAQYVEKHFRLRDQSIDEMAEALRLDPAEVTAILKELGYQLPEGV